MTKRYVLGLFILLCTTISGIAQEFVNLTAQEVSIDSILPYYTHIHEMGKNYRDSTFIVSIEYPEFVEMTSDEIAKYHAITSDTLPDMPVIKQAVTVCRKVGQLEISFIPLVFREGKYMKLISFKLNIKSKTSITVSKLREKTLASTETSSTTGRYVSHSVLALGSWAKIRVSESGIFQLTDALIKKAGFSDLSKVKIYGYGGALLNEVFTASDLIAHDDLKEIATCNINGKRLFYAQGPISWSSKSATVRTFNPYSNYGYYFITQTDSTPLKTDSATFVNSFYPSNDDYHTLYEVDNYSWFAGGRNLFDSKTYTTGSSYNYTLTSPVVTNKGTLSVALTANNLTYATIAFNDSTLGTMTISTPGDYDAASEQAVTYNVYNIKASNKVTITEKSGGTMRLDYISLYHATPKPLPSLTTTSFNTPEYVEKIENQDLHADSSYDMIIIVPTSGSLTAQAERLKAIHEANDSLKIKIIDAEKLYNEFSSGTPDATAYRKYMKMLYDRATTEANMPKYLLLFGDCAWDNRMMTSDWSGHTPKDFLLCYESENSFSETDCYVSDDYFCLLDDGEGGNMISRDKPDIGVGRFPVRDADQAKIMVDKTIKYINNEEAGSWLNTICFMGDDGNDNLHMNDANIVANMVESTYPGYQVKRVMWDAYKIVASSTGKSYPDATKLIKQQQNTGALMMNYTGHGAPYCLSHEQVLKIADFENFSSPRLPIWITASCDIMPFDGQTDNIGEEALMNKVGGAVAFFGTTRTVYSYYNRRMNLFFTNYVLGSTNGRRNTLGDAVMMSKNSLINTGQDQTANKLQYSLLGDPALRLACSTNSATIDSINGITTNSSNFATIKAGTTVKIKGHVSNNNTKLSTFNGLMSATVRDCKEKIICKNNQDNDTTFWYIDRPRTLFNGGDSVRNGDFSFTFSVPMDINYSNLSGLINLYAQNNDKTIKANGAFDNFFIGGSSTNSTDSIGPSIYCYLNSSSFINGCTVNPTPYFYAEINDDDGINATGNGIGHDLQLIIDGKTETTYVLNDYYSNDFGSYTSGTVGYSIPALSNGSHKLQFRAWDILNNSSTTELTFNVANGVEPNCFNISCTKNPATTSTTFIISHDRIDTEMNIHLQIFDMSGRLLWEQDETGTPSSNSYSVDWDLTTGNGAKLGTGIYLYRIQISSDGSSYASKAKKLIIMSNK
jgi:hypothetical protein